MGVTGLWRLIEPSGKPVPLETLENKTLAIDVSIWLHQAIKGFQDSQGAAVPNAHLLGLYHRICKLLYFRVKPIFVFDGGVPNLKKETIAKRNQLKSKKLTEAESIQKQLLNTLLKHSAVNKVLSENCKANLAANVVPTKGPTKERAEDIYKLPPKESSTVSLSDEESSDESTYLSPTKQWDVHTIDEKSVHFKALPADVRHEILTELKETRKQSSWGRIHEMPKKSDDFSSFQMKRLLKRYSVQVSIEEAEKEMGGRTLSLTELENILRDQGVVTSDSVGNRIASNEYTKYLLIKDVKSVQKSSTGKICSNKNDDNNSEVEQKIEVCEKNNISDSDKVISLSNADLEFQQDLESAIKLSLQDIPSTSKNGCVALEAESQSIDIHTENNVHTQNSILSSAKSYMIEYSGLTPNEITKIMNGSPILSDKQNILKNSYNIENASESAKTDNKIIVEKSLIENGKLISTNENKPFTIHFKENNTKETINSTLCPISSISVHNPESNSDDKNCDTFVENKTKIKFAKAGVTSINTKKNNKQETIVDVILNSNSSSEEDFFEVEEGENLNRPSNLGLEIIIKNKYEVEDDIFRDVFCSKEHDINKSTNKESDTINDSKQVPIHKSEVTLVEPVSDQHASSSTIKEIDVENQNDVFKQLKTKNVIKDFVKPLQHTENSENDKFNIQTNDEDISLSTEQLTEIEKKLHEEKVELLTEKLSRERKSNNPTEQIYQEAQELLQLFGVPYVIAPMEAEAQCAFFDDTNITNGTITDDSDVWLFGGRTVYKNFFNQQKLVMEFRAENILNHFKLSREQMILLALLVGSDYTSGIQGIGPVTALEVLAAFPPSKMYNIENELLSGLIEFRKWILGGKTVGPGRTALRGKLKNVTLPDSFPSLQVTKAYLEPAVDISEEPFSWSKPDIDGLIEFAKQKFGWARVKSEEILKPVLKRQNETRLQRSIKDYFQTKHKVDNGATENLMSKRVKRAITKIASKGEEALTENRVKSKIKKKPNRKKKDNLESQKHDTEASTSKASIKISTENDFEMSSDEDIQILKRTCVQSKKKLEQIKNNVDNTVEQTKKQIKVNLHKKDIIPQKEKDKVYALRSKLKAIEVFRKSKQGPGYIKKRKLILNQPKGDAELSESSSD